MRRLGWLAVLVAAAPSTAGAQPGRDVETFEYVVAEGESCPSIAERVYGDRRRYDIVHSYNEDLGPLPHHLEPGHRLTLPVIGSRDDGPDAEVTSIQPQVRGRPDPDRDWRSLRLGYDLSRGWRVNTLERAFAELTFRDESQISLRENTLVIVFGAGAAQTRQGATEARLDRGALSARMSELRGRLRVNTPSARADLEGGAAVVSVDEGETSRVSNFEGRPAAVSTPTGQGTVRVAPGMGSEVPRGQAPRPPRPLPPTPRWVADQPSRWVGVHQRTTVRGAWQPVPDARVYRVEISRGRRGASLVAAVEVPSDVTEFEVHQLPPGRYYARVSTIGRDFFESRPSARYEVEVVLARLRGAHVDPATEPRFDHGDASEEVGPLTVLPGSVLDAPEGLRCGLTAEPSPTSVLHAGEEGTLRCADGSDRTIGGIDLRVRPAELEVRGTAVSGRVELLLGDTRTVRVRLRSEAELPGELVAHADGIEVLSSEWDGQTLILELAAGSAGEGQIDVAHTRDAENAIASIPYVIVARPQAPPIVAAPVLTPPPLHALHEGHAASLLVSSLGVRDIDRRGVSASLSVGYLSGVSDTVGDRVRVGAEANGDLLDDHLRLGLGAAFDLFGDYERTAQRGSGDLLVSAAYLPRLEELSMMFELAAFVPTQRGEPGLGEVRLVPSAELAVRLAEDRVALRTRQGALIDLADNGNVSWASSYAADVWLIGPWSVGAEVALTLGQEDDDLLFAPTAAVMTFVDLGPLSLEVVGRFGLGDTASAVVGPASVIVSLRGGNQPYRPEVGW